MRQELSNAALTIAPMRAILAERERALRGTIAKNGRVVGEANELRNVESPYSTCAITEW